MFKPLLQEIRLKNLDYQKEFLKLKHLSFEIKKIHAAKAYRNGAKWNYIDPPYGLSKIFHGSI